MHLAAGNGHTELVRWLLREEPTLADAADTSSATPLHFACAGERSQTTPSADRSRPAAAAVRLLQGSGHCGFSASPAGAFEETALALADAGASVHARNGAGNCALHWAAQVLT